MQMLHHWIDGHAQPPESGGWLEVFNPATTQPHARVARGNTRDIESAVAAAGAAFPGWSALRNSERAAWLEKLAAALEAAYINLYRRLCKWEV